MLGAEISDLFLAVIKYTKAADDLLGSTLFASRAGRKLNDFAHVMSPFETESKNLADDSRIDAGTLRSNR